MAAPVFQRRGRGRYNAAGLVVAFSVLCAVAVLANLAYQVVQGRADAIGHASRNAATFVSKLGIAFIGLSRRIARADGSFGAVVVAALEPDHLRRFYQSIRSGRDGAVALVRRRRR